MRPIDGWVVGWLKRCKALTVNYYCDTGCDEEEGTSKEGKEGVVVPDPNAIVDPGTVMVETLNANVADSTVAGPWGSNDEAIRTEISWRKPLEQLKEVKVCSWS